MMDGKEGTASRSICGQFWIGKDASVLSAVDFYLKLGRLTTLYQESVEAQVMKPIYRPFVNTVIKANGQ
jgi:hypothetical protein